MASVKIETDRSLVASPCLRLRTARHDRFVWWARGLRWLRVEREG